MYKIGVIGKRDQILPFMSAGFSIYETKDDAQLDKNIKTATDDGCAVIFITTEYAKNCGDIIKKYNSSIIPAIIPLPEKGGGYGRAVMKEAVERAVGADIIFRD